MLKRLSVWLLSARPRLGIGVAVSLLAAALIPVAFVAPMIAVAGTLKFGLVGALPWVAAGWGLVSALQLALAPASAAATLMFASSAAIMVSALLMAVVLRRTRSLTLTLQVALMGTLALVLVYFVAFDDPVAASIGHYSAVIDAFLADSMELPGVPTDADGREAFLAQGGVLIVGAFAAWWFIGVAVVVLGGYAIWDHGAEGGQAEFGRFRELNLGRVLAISLAALALLGSALGWMAGLNAALVLLVAFGLHGCALAHWLRQRFGWHDGALVLFYGFLVLSPLVLPIWIVALCVFGYVDAWFNLVRVGPERPVR